MTAPVSLSRRLRQLAEWGDRRIDLSRPVARSLLVLLSSVVIAALAATGWFTLVDSRNANVVMTDPRAAYVTRFLEKVQLATDAAYNKEPRQRPVVAPQVRVELNPDGQIMSATVDRLSGSAALDALALRIVRESAPFEPFPPEVRRTTGSMEITTTFFFN